MQDRHPLIIVLVASIVSLAAGVAATPFWDEDEPRFAAIARTMVETGDWVVPMFNDELAVDKPVLMHWAMAAAYTLFGTSEIAARLPAAIATLLTALALLRAGTRWFNSTTGIVAALAYVGCLLVGIEAHAATPDAILTCLTTWATILYAEALLTGPDAASHVRVRWAVVVVASTRRCVASHQVHGSTTASGPTKPIGPLQTTARPSSPPITAARPHESRGSAVAASGPVSNASA